jgi:rubrerythrin
MICKEELVKRFDDYVRYFNAYCTSDAEDHEMLKAVLAMLKEQKAVEPKKENDGNPEPWTAWWYVCGDCGQPIDRMDRYCRRCGKQVKWDA